MAESYGGETEQFLASAAVSLVSASCRRGDARTRRPRAEQGAGVFARGELLAFYAKMRPFTLGGESEQYAAGEHPVVFPRWAVDRFDPSFVTTCGSPRFFPRGEPPPITAICSSVIANLAATPIPSLGAFCCSPGHRELRRMGGRESRSDADPAIRLQRPALSRDFHGEIIATRREREGRRKRAVGF